MANLHLKRAKRAIEHVMVLQGKTREEINAFLATLPGMGEMNERGYLDVRDKYCPLYREDPALLGRNLERVLTFSDLATIRNRRS